MRRSLFILMLAGVSLMAATSVAQAQFLRGGGRWGYSPGYSYGTQNSYNYSPYRYQSGSYYNPYYRSYGNSTNYYSTPYYGTPSTLYNYQGSQSQVYQSYYSGPSIQQQYMVPMYR